MLTLPDSHKAFRFERSGATLIVSLQGDCLNTEESALEREIDTLHKVLDEPAMKNIVVDIGSLPFFGSIIIGAIMALCTKAAQARPRLSCGITAPPIVTQVLLDRRAEYGGRAARRCHAGVHIDPPYDR